VQFATEAIAANPWPLYAVVLMNQVITWPSSLHVSKIGLAHTVEAVVNKLLTDLETKLGSVFTSHSLSFITVDKYGLTEVNYYKQVCINILPII